MDTLHLNMLEKGIVGISGFLSLTSFSHRAPRQMKYKIIFYHLGKSYPHSSKCTHIINKIQIRSALIES